MTGRGWPAGALSNGLGSCLCESASVCAKEPERVQMCAVSEHVSLQRGGGLGMGFCVPGRVLAPVYLCAACVYVQVPAGVCICVSVAM